MTRRIYWLGTLVVLLMAATLRLWSISAAPPGFHYDEAVNLIVARQIAFDGVRPFPVYAAFNGREVLYYYLSAGAMLGLGDSIFTMRVVSAFSNLLTIALTIGIGRMMFGKQRGMIIGLCAAAFMAISFPQIFIARQGFRAVTLPLMQALSLWALLRGLRSSRPFNIWLPIAGVATGGALYTYMASRLWPTWLALSVLLYIIANRHNWQRRFLQGVVVGIFVLLAAAPILNYYAENPDVFTDRLEQLDGDEDAPSYADSVWLHAEMFFIKGDPYIRYNDPDAPYFDPLSGMLLLVGYGVALAGFIKTRAAGERASYGLILLAPLMVVPSVLAVGGLPPSHMRSIGMVPLIFFAPALGLDATVCWLQNQQRSFITTPRLAIGIAALFALLAVAVGTSYSRWVGNEELFYLTDGDMVTAGDWLEDNIADDTLIYVTSGHYDHPSLQIFDIPGDNITYLLGDRFYFPPAGRDAYFVHTPNTPLPDIFTPYAEQFGEGVTHYNDNEQLAFIVHHYDSQASLMRGQSTSETIGGWLRLQSMVNASAIAGSSSTLITTWEILAAPPYPDLTPLFQLETPEGDILDRVEPYSARTNFWHSGEIMLQNVTFDVPHGTPPDTYVVRVAWVGRSSDQYANRLDEQGRFAGIWTDVGQLTVITPTTPPDVSQLDIPLPKSVDFGEVTLLGQNMLPSTLRPGEAIGLDLYWQATTTPSVETLQIIGESTDGTRWVWWQGAPVMDRYPFNQWQQGEIVTDRHRWRVPTDMNGGDYDVWLVIGEEEHLLGDVTIAELTRVFTPPTPTIRQNVNFADIVGLVGYALSAETVQRGESIELTVYWQSLAQTDLPLTVFVHLTDPDGINRDQRDAQPRQNSYPIALWVPDEFVADSYQLTVPADAPVGEYTLRIGLYLQANGDRLRIIDYPDDFWVLTTITVE